MKRDLEFIVDGGSLRALARSAPVWAVALAAVGILLVHWPTAASIVAIWYRSETFAHGFVVVPIAIWLAWRYRRALAATAMRPWWPGLALVFAAGALWLVASAADALGIKQFALAFMVQAAIVTVVGLAAARVLVFPLAFLLFAVPAGELLIPTLIDWTADFTFNAIRLSGVPIYREANHFILPTGAWSVVEACSGIRYIIASLMVGTIYAAVAYRSALRRALFIAASILVPIVANWLRAYMIVMLGHLSNNKLAVGVDHIIYGWVFFGLVMLLLFWVGSFWQETDRVGKTADVAAPRVIVANVSGSARPFLLAALASIALAFIWRPLDAMIDRNVAPGVPALPAIAEAGGWLDSGRRIADWKPNYVGYAAMREQTFSNGNRDVGVYIAYYRNQQKGRELITSGNVLTTPANWDWKQLAEGSDRIEWSGRPATVDRVELSSRQMRLQVFRLYWVADRITTSPYVAKALQAWWKLAGRGDDAALIVMYAPIRTSDSAAQDSLRTFAAAMSPGIERALKGALESPQ